jgi:hypothetical protein
VNPRLFVSLSVLVALAQAAAAQAPAPGDADAETLLLLRQTIAEQTRHPDKILRTLTNDAPVAKPAASAATPRSAAAAELERRYLAGKMSQREYEKALARLQLQPPGLTNAPAKAAARPAPKIASSPKASSGPPPALEPAIPTPPPQPTERQKKISEVESRLDDMIRAKEARERTAQTNEVKTAPGQKLTKRERMDFLLRQVVQGKLSDEEYKKERERILAEPD